MWTETTRAQYRHDELRYASDTRAAEWRQIAPLLPPRRRLGRPPEWGLRVIVNAILYLSWAGRMCCRPDHRLSGSAVGSE